VRGLFLKEERDGDEGEAMRAGVRLSEEQEAKLTALQAAVIEGEQSGPSTPFDFDAFIARKRAQRRRNP
jgi:antitoxin ParD1/3/4